MFMRLLRLPHTLRVMMLADGSKVDLMLLSIAWQNRSPYNVNMPGHVLRLLQTMALIVSGNCCYTHALCQQLCCSSADRPAVTAQSQIGILKLRNAANKKRFLRSLSAVLHFCLRKQIPFNPY